MATSDFIVKNGLVVNQNLDVKGTTQFTSTVTAVGDLIIQGNTTVGNQTSDTFTVNTSSLATGAATFSLAGSAATTTLNIGGSATAVSIGASTGTTTVNNDLTVSGGDIVTAAATASNLYATTTTGNIELASGLTSGTLIVGGGSQTGTITIDRSASAHTLNIGTGANASGVTKTISLGTGGAAGSTTNITVGAATGGTTTISSPEFVVSGNLTVNGTTTTINATTITVDDKNIELGSVASPTDATANGGGITLKGATDKTILWVDATDRWTSNQNFEAPVFVSNVATGTAPFTVTSTTLVPNLYVSSAATVNATATVASTATLVTGIMSTNDSFRIVVGDAGVADTGYVEFRTEDNGTEPIYFRQYTSGTPTRTLTLLDGSGNTSMPGNLTVSGNTTLGDANTDSVTINGKTTIEGLAIGTGGGNFTSNVAFGLNALAANLETTGGEWLVAIGEEALLSNTSGASNIGIGSGSLRSNTNGSDNIAIGYYTLWQNLGGNLNTAVGYSALSDNTSGQNNVAIGANSLGTNSISSNNIAVGYDALNLTTGGSNVAIGYRAGASITTGASNVVIGGNTGTTIATLSNRIIISDGDGNIRISVDNAGNATLQGDLTVSGGDIVTAAGTASNLYATTTTGNIGLATGLTSGTLIVGGAAQTGTITLDRSTSAHTLNIGTGVNASGVTKTVNIATGGAAGSTTTITIGSTLGSSTTLNGSVSFPLADGTAPFAVTSTTRVSNLNVARAGTADVWTTGRNLTIGNTTKAVSGAADVTWSSSEIGYDSSFNTPTVGVTKARFNYHSGRTLNPDEEFSTGINGLSLYNNSGGTNVVISRLTGQVGIPNSTNNIVRITYNGGGIVSPGTGGFTFTTGCRANARFIARFLAIVPVGRNIQWASNSIGTNGISGWITSNAGTGKWEEYAYEVICGDSGTFSSTNFFYLDGSAAYTWDIASATVIDVTDKTNLSTISLTTGATLTSGTVTGQWTLNAGSTWQATFADLAEWYSSDEDYEAGTVVVFGGEFETTISTTANDRKVAGVVSTNPAFIMNVDQPGPSACVALQGKVPVKVIGTVAKGDLLVTSDTPGVAMVNNDAGPYAVIGKSLENKTTTEQGLIYVSVGR